MQAIMWQKQILRYGLQNGLYEDRKDSRVEWNRICSAAIGDDLWNVIYRNMLISFFWKQ